MPKTLILDNFVLVWMQICLFHLKTETKWKKIKLAPTGEKEKNTKNHLISTFIYKWQTLAVGKRNQRGRGGEEKEADTDIQQRSGKDFISSIRVFVKSKLCLSLFSFSLGFYIRGDRETKLSGWSETKYCPPLPPSSLTEITFKIEGGMKPRERCSVRPSVPNQTKVRQRQHITKTLLNIC